MIAPFIRRLICAGLFPVVAGAASISLTGVTPVSSGTKTGTTGAIAGNTTGADPSTFAFGLSPAATAYFQTIIPGSAPANYRAWEGKSALAAAPGTLSRADAVLAFRMARAYVRQAFRIDLTELTFIRTDNADTFEADRVLLAQLVAAGSQAEFSDLCHKVENPKACRCAEAVLSDTPDRKYTCPEDL
jgi:hypothetical protein